MFIDAHAHLTASSDPALADTLVRAKEANVKAIINICCDVEDLKRGLDLAAISTLPKIYTVAATTPHDAEKKSDTFFSLIEQCALEGKLVAIGETGLDYHYLHATKERQQDLLRRFYRLAHKSALPIVIHCREAFEDLFLILDEERSQQSPAPPVMLHCFTGSMKEAEAALSRGWYLSLSGLVTFPKSVALQEVARMLPLDRLLIETDSPYLAPQGHRGKKNEPAFLKETAKFLAALRKIPVEELGMAAAKNAERLFKLDSIRESPHVC